MSFVTSATGWGQTDSYNGSNVRGYIVYKVKSESDKGVKVSPSGTPSSLYSLSDAHIFLPLAGIREGNGLIGDRINGSYWSSSLFFEDYAPSDAWAFRLFSDLYLTNYGRYYGMPVRAVFK